MRYYILGNDVLIHFFRIYINAANSDPDQYRFRIVTLPSTLTNAPHSLEANEIVLEESVVGDPIRGWYRYVRGNYMSSYQTCRVSSATEYRKS